MGDRAVLIFIDRDDSKYCPANATYSTSLYIHSQGSKLIPILENALPRLKSGSTSNLPLIFAIFCHQCIEGYMGLSSFDSPTVEDISNNFKRHDPGDNGVFLVKSNLWNIAQYQDGRLTRKYFLTEGGRYEIKT